MFKLVYLYAVIQVEKGKYVKDAYGSRHPENTVLAHSNSKEKLRNWMHDNYPYDTAYLIEPLI